MNLESPKKSKMSCTETNLIKFDVFLSFRGLDTRRNLISFLYKELTRKNIRTFRDDKELESGCRISPELIRAIEDSRVAVVVVSENYSASTWCLEELVKIIDFANKGSITVMPIFYGVDPSNLRWQIGTVAEHFKKHEAREDHEKVLLWRQALYSLASISGDCSEKWEDDSEMVDEITERIAKTLIVTTTPTSDLVGTDVHMEALHQLMDLNSNKDVRVMGIWARGGHGRSALAKLVYKKISQHFKSHCFLDNVKKCSQNIHLWNLQQRVSTLKNQKVLLVADDVNTLEQLDALAQYYTSFGPGSVVIITTQDKMLLKSFGINLVYEAEFLKFQVRELFRQIAFREKNEFESVLDRAMNLAVEWLGYQLGTSG